MQPRIVTRLRPRNAVLRIERLDERALPSATAGGPVYPMVMAGSPNLSPSDTPADRVDPNTIDSPFGGVGSIVTTTQSKTYLGTGAAIDSRHVLTAAHVFDLNNDGVFDAKDKTTGVYFVLNFGGDATQKIAISDFAIDPFFTGFNHPSVNDDIAVLTLAEDLPPGVPIYQLPTSDLSVGTPIIMVGYGRSGSGGAGYTTSASPVIKRVGQNVVDAFYGQDDKGQPEQNEVFRFDFDGPKGNGPLGGPSLGNKVETQLGPGDSGGPSFVAGNGGYVIVGVNTFIQGRNAPRFGSMGGGVNVFAYLRFIHSVIDPLTVAVPPPDDGSFVRPVDSGGSMLGLPGTAPSQGGAGIGIGARPVSGEFAIADHAAGSSGFGTFGQTSALLVSAPTDTDRQTSDAGSVWALDGRTSSDRISFEPPLSGSAGFNSFNVLSDADLDSLSPISIGGIPADV